MKDRSIFKYGNNKLYVEFGNGDIDVTSGFIDNPETNIATVSFSPREPVEIGTKGGPWENGECFGKTEGAQLCFLFKKIESIDVVIRVLQSAKDLMLSAEG